MAKKDSERHTLFLSVVFKPEDGRKVLSAAKRAHMKKSAWARMVILQEIDREKRRKG